MAIIPSGTENGTIDPFEIPTETVDGTTFEYTRRYTTLDDPLPIGDILARRVFVTDFEIVGGRIDGSNLIGNGNFSGIGTDFATLQVYGPAYFSSPVLIGGFYDAGDVPCPVDLDDVDLYVANDTVLRRNLGVGGDCCIGGDLTVVGVLSKGGGAFDIVHPTQEEKRLRHSFIEGPRYDNIYRNKVRLSNGKATINLDTDCVSPGGQTMTPGTWEKLNKNPDIFLQNLEGWSRLKGKINGSILEIECEDENCTDLISWMVVAERQDDFIVNSEMSDDKGRLILEYES